VVFVVIPLYGGVPPNGGGVVFVAVFAFVVILREVAGSIFINIFFQ
jgi:hypothetical protein